MKSSATRLSKPKQRSAKSYSLKGILVKSFFCRFLNSLIILGAFTLSVFSQNSEKGIVVNVVQKSPDRASTVQTPEFYLNGYRKALNGQVLMYHSSHPDAQAALLVRAQRETQSISWETDTLRAPVAGDFYNLIWLAGLEQAGWGENKPSHKFELSINGEHWFTFKNYRDSTAKNWTVAGKNGAELSFKASTVDKYGDLFGYMYLKLPVKDFKPGSPLVMRIDGEDAGSMDWYMAFEYAFNFTPRLRVEPVLLKGPGHSKQVLRLSLDNLNDGRTVEILPPTGNAIRDSLKIGANIFMLPIDEVDKEKDLSIEFRINGKTISHNTVREKPVTHRDVYLLPYSHNDIGYTDVQPNVERTQWKNLETSLGLIKATHDYPPEAQFKWNIEILWPLDGYLRQASQEKKDEVIAAIKDGHIGVQALYANPLTGLATAAEMSHFTDFARRLRTDFSIPVTTALVSDVPGFTWGIVSALAQSGVKYFASAPNNGDRIGYIIDQWGDKPFYWTSQSGEEKVLFFVAAASYSMFHEGDLSRLGDEKMLKFIRQLDEQGYPYEMVYLPYTLGDNGAPDPRLSDFVRNWNARYSSPRLIISTHQQMFEEFEKHYGETLPSFKGDLTPYWEDGAASTAFETALNRQATDRLIQCEALCSMPGAMSYPKEMFDEAWRDVVLWDEHTWGASNSVEEPDSPNVSAQWKIKQKFALDADSLSREILRGVLPSAKTHGTKEFAVDVYNTCSWPRTDIVLLTKEQSTPGDIVVDEHGHRVPSQRLTTGQLAILAKNVPPFSARRFRVKKGSAPVKGSARVSGMTLGNDFLSVTLNEQSGAIQSLQLKKDGAQFVDTAQSLALNQYLYVRGKNPDSAQSLSNVKVKIGEQGGLLSSLIVDADAPGCKHYSSEIRIVDGIDRVDIIDRLDKQSVRDKEAVHIAFPFNVPGGQLRYDVADGIVRPEIDQLKGACKNFVSVQGWVDVSNDNGGLTWTTADAPEVEIGAMNAEQPWMKSIEPSTKVFSYAMNNYWHTNYKADQEGPVTFHYSITLHGGFKPEDATKFGIEQRQPLIVADADLSRHVPGTIVHVDPQDVLVTSLKPIERGNTWLIRLYNPSAHEQNVTLQWNKLIPAAFSFSDNFGSSKLQVVGPVTMPAYATRLIRVDRQGDR